MFSRFTFLVAGMFGLVSSLSAAIVANYTDGVHNVAPGTENGWSYTGQLSGGTGVYLGNYGGQHWAMTANHVSTGSTFTIDGTGYSIASGSAQRIGTTDMKVFRLDSGPSLANLDLSLTTPPVTTSYTQVSEGRIQNSTDRNWYVEVVAGDNNDLWFDDFQIGRLEATGWEALATREKRWGTNTVEFVDSQTYTIGSTSNTNVVLRADFDDVADEVQGVNLDSGSPVFTGSGGTLQLVGIVSAVALFDNQPVSTFTGQAATTAVYGNQTWSVDVATYRNDILAAVPEPRWAGLLMGLVVLGLVGRRYASSSRR